MMWTLLHSEFAKLKGTLALVLCATAPVVAASMAGLIALRQTPVSADALMTQIAALWAYFVMPMTIAALSALIAQVEHGPRMWDHLLALPISRMQLFIAKALTMAVLVGVMTVSLVPLSFLTCAVLAALSPAVPSPFGLNWTSAATLAALMWLASFAVCALQLWVALRFRSFVAPVLLGLVGTFAVVAGMGAKELVFLPWAMPMNMMPLGNANPALALVLGALGGVGVLVLMTFDLSRKEI